MAIRGPELCGHSIVLRGDLNTRIFQPSWFAAQGLIRESEAKKANIEIIHRDIVVFSLDWLRIQITPDRFIASTIQEPFNEVARDLVVGTFGILSHTPVRMLGINYETHTRLSDEEGWRRIQARLSQEKATSEIFGSATLKTISFEDKREYNAYPGAHIVKIEPSVKVEPGVYVGTNDHYVVEDKDPGGSGPAIDILRSEWVASSRQAEEYRSKLMELV